jgi:hypothetical protein
MGVRRGISLEQRWRAAECAERVEDVLATRVLVWIVVARPEDVVHLELDEPEFWVKVRPASATRVVTSVATPEMSAPRTTSLNGARGGSAAVQLLPLYYVTCLLLPSHLRPKNTALEIAMPRWDDPDMGWHAKRIRVLAQSKSAISGFLTGYSTDHSTNCAKIGLQDGRHPCSLLPTTRPSTPP